MLQSTEKGTLLKTSGTKRAGGFLAIGYD